MVMRRQTIVQLSDELIERLDREARQRGISRSRLIREAVEEHLSASTHDEIDRQIVESYTRLPQEDLWGDEPAIAMIEAEPW
jgi:predicted transcriptional regulator